jgi:hypothetical protein
MNYDNEKNMPFQAARFIRYFGGMVAQQKNEHSREYWAQGLEVAQGWQRLANEVTPSRQEIEDLASFCDARMKDHSSAGYEMYLYVLTWKCDLYGGNVLEEIRGKP